MGLRKESISLLMQEGLKKPLRGKILTLGKQDVSATYEEVLYLSKKLNYSLQPVDQIELSEKPEMKEAGYISDRTLFAMLGFEEIKSLDASPYEGADILFDMNQGVLPQQFHESFDLVLDPGTIEHVFHLPNCLKNIFQFTKIGGRIIHLSPSSNHMDHGFYMFSPTFFRDYYAANRFQVNLLKIIKYKPQLIFPWKIADYSTQAFAPFSFGGLDSNMYAVYCVATKETHSTFNQIPQQFNYAENLWNKPAESKRAATFKKMIKKSKILYWIGIAMIRIYHRSRLSNLFANRVD